MADKTSIEWTDATWNPVTGCDEVSPGCDNCYAKTLAERFRGVEGHYFEQGFDVVIRENMLALPFSWRKPRRVFVNSMSDLFHAKVSDDYIVRVFAIMAITPQHTYQLLTKRHGRMRSLLNDAGFWYHVGRQARHFGYHYDKASNYLVGGQNVYDTDEWERRRSLDNVWLGVSVEDQQRADLRIPALLDTPAAKRFLSCEPLLGPIDLLRWVQMRNQALRLPLDWLHWVIVGGESGHGARPMHPDWVRALRDQCADAEVPFFFKQWGEWAPEDHIGTARGAASALYIEHDGTTRPAARGARGNAVTVQRNGKKHTGHLLDRRKHQQFPEEAPSA